MSGARIYHCAKRDDSSAECWSWNSSRWKSACALYRFSGRGIQCFSENVEVRFQRLYSKAWRWNYPVFSHYPRKWKSSNRNDQWFDQTLSWSYWWARFGYSYFWTRISRRSKTDDVALKSRFLLSYSWRTIHETCKQESCNDDGNPRASCAFAR